MHLYIKNMVCNRCIMVVKDILEKAGQEVAAVKLGEAELKEHPGAMQMERITERLNAVGFELLTDQKKKTIEKIKNTILDKIRENNFDQKHNFSDLLSAALNRDYSYLSKLFSSSEGVTIEKYIIDQKIERVKELLAYGEHNLSEIAFLLNYSSTAHLSAQFKKVTGFSPSEFRKLTGRRRSLDEL